MYGNDLRYKHAPALEQLCALLGLSVGKVLRRAKLPTDFLTQLGRGPTPAQYFDIWEAVCAESGRDDLALFLGRAYAKGPFNPAVFAFSQSPDVLSGLHRLAIFKPLIGPCHFDVVPHDQGVDVTISSVWPNLSLPPSMHTLEIVYILENIRHCTDHHVIPIRIEMPFPDQVTPQEAAYFGAMPAQSDRLKLTISMRDAALPLLAKELEQWAWIEADLKHQIAQADASGSVANRVKAALVELLPAGLPTLDHASNHLHLSVRTLQRQLAAEGTSFQAVLDETRCELALQYLRSNSVSIDEISFLLAYSATNSFYRAFHGWTGMTPQQARRDMLTRAS